MKTNFRVLNEFRLNSENLSEVVALKRPQSLAQQDFLKLHNNCVLCGEELEFQYVRLAAVDKDDLQMQEIAKCQSCDRRVSKNIFSIQ